SSMFDVRCSPDSALGPLASGLRRPQDPYHTSNGDFRDEDTGPTVALHTPTNEYYFACIHCGTELDRGPDGFNWNHRRPEGELLRNWSFRISQFAIEAIDISQIVAEWVR